MIIDEGAYLAHYGILRKSGRYPWGSGGTQSARNRSFLDITEGMRKDGMSDTEIARGFGMTTTELRALRSIAGNEQKRLNIAQAQRLRDKGLSNVAIGQKMGINESSVRSLLEPGKQDRADVLQTTAKMLKQHVDEKKFVDIGAGVENQLGISGTKLNTAVAMLEEQGYKKISVQIDQVTNGQNKTTTKVLCPPGTTYRDVVANKDQIRQITSFSEDGGRSSLNMHPPISISSKRIGINYGEEGGKADGVIFIRPGVPDVSIGSARYAQVRIAVDGSHYLKGMAVYKDDLPAGVDLQFNTPKKDTGNKLDAMKPMKDEPDNPFGSVIRQIHGVDAHGKDIVTSAMNIVGSKDGAGAEGGWDTWSKSLSTQVLSKQSPKLAQQQLDVTYTRKKAELEELRSLTNPVVRRMLIEKFADGADSSAVELKAAALPRQATKVILPISSLKDTEVYAPTFRNGERVALIRYPHGGKFEIPELTVNNNHPPARKLLGMAQDAIGINHKVAERLSGADFDGDTVVVIPNNAGHIHSEPALKSLKGFDAKRLYSLPDSVPRMTPQAKGMQMGLVSNLITDMTIKGASNDEIARAVKHSMVVIDAEKHHLDYKQSYIDHGIKDLNKKYGSRAQGGADTLISKATSKKVVEDRKLRSARDGGPIDPRTGKLVYEAKPQGYTTRDGVFVAKRKRVDKLAAVDNAHDLITGEGTPIEKVYADHSNRMKALANEARVEVAAFKPPLISKSAKTAYKPEVVSLNAKLSLARKNKPLERQAQVFANAVVAQKRDANPSLESSDLKKIKSQALAAARIRTGAEKARIVPSPQEWAAIQAGAVSHNQLKQILDNADLDAVRALATPRTAILMTPAKSARARAMAAAGHTQAEIADALGVSLTTLKTSLT